MDFGFMGIEAFIDGKPKCNGSGSIKQERSGPFDDEGTRVLDSKIPKRVDDLGLRSDNNSFPKQQMLSFSSFTKPELSFFNSKDDGLISDKIAQNLTLSSYQQSAYSRSLTGFGSGNINGGMHGSFNGIRGPFTPAQWIELEHQAMIHKYFTANVPVPANLLIPIRKALSSSGFPGFSVGSYPAHSYGWGSFHLGFSGSTDPEPGRCRRTDGKKWRCSRDAVPDQKYCERHINRGRHRSRKPVEGHTGQAASGPTNTNTKVVPALPASMSSLVTSCGSAPNRVTIAQHQIKSLQPTAGATSVSGDPAVNRLHDQQGLSVMRPPINLQSKDSTFSVPKQLVSLGDSLQSEFGFVPNDSLLNPSHKSSNLGYKSYNSLLEFNAQQSQDQHPLRHFMDDQSSRSAIPWPEEVKSDWTQLSMSFPMSSGLSSSASTSPNQDKMTVSPLRLSSVLELSKTGLGVPIMDDETGTKQNAWKIPIAWGNNAMGGPLGEVLNSANNAMGSCESASSNLNRKSDGDGWASTGSPQLGASPTGVLHRSTFVSLSNSSSGGSPRRDNKKTQEGVSLC